MPNNGRAPGAHVVDVLLTLDVPDVRTLRPFDKTRCTAHCAVSPDGRVHAADQHLLSAIKLGLVGSLLCQF